MAVGGGLAIVLQCAGGRDQVVEDAGLHPADDIDVGVVIGLELVERPDQGILLEDVLVQPGAVGELDRVLRRREERRGVVRLGARQHPALVVDDIDGRNRPGLGLDLQEAAEGDRAGAEDRLLAVQVHRHRLDVAGQGLLLVVQIGPGHGGGVLHHRPHPLGKPVLHPARDQGAEEQGHDDGRHDRAQGEHGDEAHVQARAGVLPPLAQHLEETPADGRRQAQDQHQVAEHRGQHDAAGRSRPAGARRAGREIDGGDGQEDRDRIAEAQDDARPQPAAPRGDAILQAPGGGGHRPTLRRLCPKLNIAVALMRHFGAQAFVRTA